METQQIFNEIEHFIIPIINDNAFNFKHMPQLFKIAMEAVETRSQWTSEMKRDVAIDVVKKILQTFANKGLINENTHAELETALLILGPSIMSLCVSATKGLININKKKCCIVC